VPPPQRPTPPSSPDDGETAPRGSREEPMLVCPNCGSTLTERKCKLLCPNPLCGYYLSCSDYY
jgi:hypothetical protein